MTRPHPLSEPPSQLDSYQWQRLGPDFPVSSTKDNKESKKKDLEASNGKSTTATMSPPSYKSCTEMNGVNGHKNHSFNRLAPELLHLNSLGPQNSFPLAPISTSIST